MDANHEEIVHNTYADIYYTPPSFVALEDDGTYPPRTRPIQPNGVVRNLVADILLSFEFFTHEINHYNNLSDYIDKMPHGIIDKHVPGIGATTLEIKSNRNSIIVLPTQVLAYSKSLKHPKTLYVGGEIETKTRTSKNEITDYLQSVDIPHKKFLVVIDSLKRLIEILGVEVYSSYFLMIDEIDILQTDVNYRPELENVIDYYFKFDVKNRCVVTATMKEFSNPKFKNETTFDVSWRSPLKRNIKLLQTNNINEILRTELLIHSGEKIFVAYNSISEIRKVISLLSDEVKSECSILCSRYTKVEAGRYYGVLTEDNALPSRINFATCCYFSGIDIEDKYHLITVSNIKKNYQVLSADRMEQIYGRCRVEEGILSDTIIYNIHNFPNIINSKHYLDNLTRIANKYIELIRAADAISQKDKDLQDLFEIVKLAIKDKSYGKGGNGEIINLVRRNIDKEFVPAYLNMDFLIDRLHASKLYANEGKALLDELTKRGHTVMFSESLNEVETEEVEKEEENEIVDDIIEQAKANIKKLEELGQLNRRNINKLKVGAIRAEKIFYNRFLQLYEYVSTETLLNLLWDIRSKNNKAFKRINNAVMFVALEDKHPLKTDLKTTMKMNEKYTSNDLHKIITPIIKYHFHKSIEQKQRVSIFLLNSMFKTERVRNDYVVIGENPLELPSPQNMISKKENNLLKYFYI